MENANQMLLLASRTGSLEKIEQALAAGADVNACEWDGTTPLMRCLLDNRDQAAALLLSKGANPNRANRYGTTPLFIACQADSPVDVANVLIRAGADINLSDPDGWTPLMRSVVAGREQLAIFLVQVGAAVDAKNAMGQTVFDLPQIKNNLALGDTLRSAMATMALLDDDDGFGATDDEHHA
jgi:tankyrase